MILTILLLLIAGSAPAQDPLTAELDQVARTATAMVDGDVARGIQTKRSIEMMLEKNPRDHWAAADNYDVDHDAYVATKKTLIRLSKLCTSACDVNLWLPVTGKPDRVHVVIRNVNEISQFWRWGDLDQPMPPEMKAVLESGRRQTVRQRGTMISVLAPVYDSLGDIVGLVEVAASTNPNPQENVQ